MASFFEKLKKGMGVEEQIKDAEETTEEPVEERAVEKERAFAKPKKQKVRQLADRQAVEKKAPELEKKSIETKTDESEEKKIETKKVIPQKEEKPSPVKEENKDRWSAFGGEPEGQLAIDVYQTEEYLVIQSAIAGVKPESLDISIEGDMILIKGNRERPTEEEERNYFYQECFWGPFSAKLFYLSKSIPLEPKRS